MTAQFLSSELLSLIQDSKRKNQALRNAAEQSLNSLKALPTGSEAQLAADLKCRPTFVKPFLFACSTRNLKLAVTGIACLQRLIVSNAVSNDSLEEVLDALRACASLEFEVQLKVLQALPSLLQNYGSFLKGHLLVAAFQICFLLHASKTAVVSNTAAATLQQFVSSIFDKVVSEDAHSSDDDPSTTLTIGEAAISVRESALDAYHLLNDICLLTEGQKPETLLTASLSQNFGLELLESIFSSYVNTIESHIEQIYVCKVRLVPFIVKLLSERATFSTTLRAIRVVRLIVSRLLPALGPQCELMLSLLNHLLDPDNSVSWKRALCLEAFQGFYVDTALVQALYSQFDEQDQKRNIIKDNLAILVRIASEKPNIIGSRQKFTPNLHSKEASAENVPAQAINLAGSIGAAITPPGSDTPGISKKWSILRMPCIEQLDKTDAPELPAAYIYGLALTCINYFSEGLAKFLLPLTLPIELKEKTKPRTSQKNDEIKNTLPRAEDGNVLSSGSRNPLRHHSTRYRSSPINPLSLEDHVLYRQICTSGNMVDQCWPALLAAYSTFLNAALDSEFTHALIRSFQRFTQVAGLLELLTPRDAFLTTLGKFSLLSAGTPSQANLNKSSSSAVEITDESLQNEQNSGEDDIIPSPSTPSGRQRHLTPSTMVLSTRNLLCLRALLNLGVALGPLLQRSWSIILNTLQQADLLLSSTGPTLRQISGHLTQSSDPYASVDDMSGVGESGAEVTAVRTASSRLFESTSDLPGPEFLDFLDCLCNLLSNDQASAAAAIGSLDEDLLSPNVSLRKYFKPPSISGSTLDAASSSRKSLFVIDKIGETITYNIPRFLEKKATESGWDLIVKVFINSISLKTSDTEVRVKAAVSLNKFIVAVVTSQDHSSPRARSDIGRRGLIALLGEISSLYGELSLSSKMSQGCDFEIHRLSLETLRLVLEQCADSLDLGWDTVFAIITSIFSQRSSADLLALNAKPNHDPRFSTLLRCSFGSLQLICSDFLRSVPHSHLLKLLETMYAFCSQEDDLNVSLTTITFFRNLSDFLMGDGNRLEFNTCVTLSQIESNLLHILQEENSAASAAALWICLLLQLMKMTNDNRIEARHGSLHTIFRILEAGSDHLNALAWQVCYQSVILEMLKANEVNYTDSNSHLSPRSSEGLPEGWNDTAIVMLGGVSDLFTQSLNMILADNLFAEIWGQLLKYFNSFLDRRRSNLSTAVFKAMTKMLASIESSLNIEGFSITDVWKIWKDGNPVSHTDASKGWDNNQECLVAYLNLLHQMYRLIGNGMSLEQAKDIAERLRSCVTNSDAAAYSSDLDSMTTVQTLVLESMRTMPINAPGALSELIDCIGAFVVLAYDSRNEKPNQTYVALSKAAMDLLGSCTLDFAKSGQIQNLDLLVRALEALNIPLKLKYKWRIEGKEPVTWKKATVTALEILEASVPKVLEVKDASKFWNVAVKICDGVISADCASCTTPLEMANDQEFDIEAFSRIRRLFTSRLGSPCISDMIRRKYTESLFRSSIIHEPHPDDLARPGQELLQGLRSSHIGRTQDLSPSPRSKLSYMLVEELFSLVSAGDGTTNYLKLAQAAAPYLILRAGITLKAYISDQPLRGRMPQPLSQKNELLHILQKLEQLDSEPRAIPDAAGVTSEHKKHLHRLYPLVVRALDVAWRDDEVMEALRKILEAVGQDFGV